MLEGTELNQQNLFVFRVPEDPWKIKPENIHVNYNKKLGSGAFADVFVGEMIGNSAIKDIYPDLLILANFHDCEVAVKTLPLHVEDEWSKNDFLQVSKISIIPS
jgi:hypothetical protein